MQLISMLPELTGAEKTSPEKEGFFIENGYVHIWAQKFSTYAVIYDEVVTVPVEDNDSNEEDSQTTANASLFFVVCAPWTHSYGCKFRIRPDSGKSLEQNTCLQNSYLLYLHQSRIILFMQTNVSFDGEWNGTG